MMRKAERLDWKDIPERQKRQRRRKNNRKRRRRKKIQRKEEMYQEANHHDYTVPINQEAKNQRLKTQNNLAKLKLRMT